MIRSMTAFSRFSGTAKDGNWSIEIRSLNHRYFEFSLRTSQNLYSLETKVRDMVQSVMKRGKISVSISCDTSVENGKGLELDEDAVKFYISAFRKIKKKYGIKDELSFHDLALLPKVFTAARPDEASEKSWPSLKKALDKALSQAVKAKEIEGSKLSKDISMRLGMIEGTVTKVEKHTKTQADSYFNKLRERVTALAGDAGLDADRLHREVAFLSERSDITEEIVRLNSHLELFRNKLIQKTEVGRELDFLCQEMNREVNTMGSKSQFFEISTQVVAMKRELEKIREQVQNVE